LLCYTALVYGFAEQKPSVVARIVDDVAHDKQKRGIWAREHKRRRAPGSEPGESVHRDPVPALGKDYKRDTEAARLSSDGLVISETKMGPYNDEVIEQPEKLDSDIISYLKKSRSDLYSRLNATVRSLKKKSS